ncbi:hypothetical protein EV639_11464 [Rathayibacter tanaceti]|uniref:Uncharacterized protein n=2 Tax=Rathayibacter tanaceti TaxID=1671680 RepID=A0ACD2XGG2_9MICO|nr:hypothetical protein ACH61_02666 [Rathayibacter tanaceti]TCO33781.1 hypothetical protein EV639_11464 [Rathayibacter tanaceti]
MDNEAYAKPSAHPTKGLVGGAIRVDKSEFCISLNKANEAFANAEGAVGIGAPAGKIVAQVMLGTWVNLLGKGGERFDGTRSSYVADLWEPALKQCFSAPRKDVARLAQRMNWARNRISHCEPVVFGLPMPGLGTPVIQVRRAPQLIFEDTQELLRVVSPLLASWLDRWGGTRALCAHRLALRALDHIAQDATIQLDR